MDSWRWAEDKRLRRQPRPWKLNPYEEWAHFVNGYNTNEKFIVTRLPELERISAFFDMIFEQNVDVIVVPGRITQEEDLNHQHYWNVEGGQPMPNMRYTLDRRDGVITESYMTVDIILKCIPIPDKFRAIRVFLFTDWLDEQCIPNTVTSFYSFVEEVNIANGVVASDRETCNPIVVHSTEMGGASMYCAVDIGMDYGANKHAVNINNVINRVCQGFFTGNITDGQYEFIKEAMMNCNS